MFFTCEKLFQSENAIFGVLDNDLESGLLVFKTIFIDIAQSFIEQ
jgi:hypothetical protein